MSQAIETQGEKLRSQPPKVNLLFEKLVNLKQILEFACVSHPFQTKI